MAQDDTGLIDVGELSLARWLELLADPPNESTFVDYKFQTADHLQEYAETISERSEDDVYKLLLKFLIPSTSMGCDERHFHSLRTVKRDVPELYEAMIARQYYRRLVLYKGNRSKVPPWEGITWVLDLLPHFPNQALMALEAYILAHAQELPDGRFEGLSDASAVIRAKFIGLPGNQDEEVQFLLERSPRDFEHLVERLYSVMGYKTELTPPQKDGGRDVLAATRMPGKAEQLLVECKRHSGRIGVEKVRALNGVARSEKVNKGVLITTSSFTRPADKFAEDNHLELIPGDQLVRLMNEHLGAKWALHVDRLITESRLKNASN